MFVGANLIFLPQHFLGLSGKYKNSYYNRFYSVKPYETNNFPYGPHLRPIFLKTPLRIYFPKLDRNLIGTENKNRVIIYQWFNLINGKSYVGSTYKGSIRLLGYFNPSTISRNLPIYNNITNYGHNNFCLAILEDLGSSTCGITKQELLKKEQFFLDIMFNLHPLNTLNLSPTAAGVLSYKTPGTLGFRHSEQFKLNRSKKLNPMYNRVFSKEFINMQTRDRKGRLNPMFGVAKSPETIAKLQKLIYVYDSINYDLIGIFPTVTCSKHFKMGKNTLTKYLDLNIPFKGKLFYSSVCTDFSKTTK